MRFLCEMCFLCALSDNFCLQVIFILDKQFSNATAAGFAAPGRASERNTPFPVAGSEMAASLQARPEAGPER
jgi:hypothetical protein